MKAVPPRAFTPIQKFFSAVIQLQRRQDCDLTLFPYLEQVTVPAFQLKRATLQQSLLQLWPQNEIERVLAQCGLEGKRRSATLTVEEFVSLAQQLHSPIYTLP